MTKALWIEIAALVANILLTYIANTARKINSKIEDHDRAIYGDNKTGWPGILALLGVDPDDPDPDADPVRADGGHRGSGGDS